MAEFRIANKGPWTHRFLVHSLTIVLGILIYWLLGFVLDDVGNLPGPDINTVRTEILGLEVVTRSNEVHAKIDATERQIAEQKGRQKILRDSTDNSQQTMNQLLEMHKLALSKNVTPTAEEQRALADGEQQFLTSQKEYQATNEAIARLDGDLRAAQDEQRTLAERDVPVMKEYDLRVERHLFKTAAVKLLAIMPLLLLAGWLFRKYRGGTYAALVYAFGIAVLLEIALVMQEYFPSDYFKYVLILGSLAVVLKALVSLLRMMAHPKGDWLLKQYREAYEAFLCPVCEYPIRRGPLKYLYWTRRSIKKLLLPAAAAGEIEQTYTCPMCGTRLYEECNRCHAIRHALLPVCEKCGSEKPVAVRS